MLDGGSSVAEVVELKGNEASIVTGGLRMRVKLERLQKVGGPRKQQVQIASPVAAGEALPAMHARQRIDQRGQRVDEALQEVTRLVDEALTANISHLEILHGKGTGALRAAIHDYLARRSVVLHFEEAPWNQGGAGVTLVELR